MGCGKTTIGQALHHETGLPFLDTDHFIEDFEEMTITQIFQTKGEAYFRSLETSVLEKLIEENTPDGCIISTGGGIVLRPENRELLQKLGFVVWLNTDPETIIQRIGKNKDRPLIQTENPVQRLREIIAERTPIYQSCAHLIIETAPLTSQETVCGIIESARHFFTHQEN